MLEAGTTVPPFTIPTDTGSFSIAENLGSNVVVFFFPRADTGSCTKEAVAFSGLMEQFSAANCSVIGISKDTAAKQAKFRAKHGLSCELGADDETDICEQFGVWVEKSMYGKSYMGIQRATFLIDASGTIVETWPKVKVPGHAEAVLERVQSL
ncbi:MAG: peroxiredoxin [Pseudomonadota bacterium]|nr:peroxiredoxin [Pseudomonadota bacterium]MEC7362253.1 peroxiredoxin [Pseudomonadota bacterium]MEC7486260.1 peroxiredoxin [Pseudomonadota bacterium]MEC7615508.1 peroxiredoxin [Pseudomonadota bacterium]MEC7650455.1 peroxiredoxin [Pseudomonadota bacterium]